MINVNIKDVYRYKDKYLKLITFKNKKVIVEFFNYGARIYKIYIANKYGKKENITLSLDNYKDILNDNAHFGATIGPFAGRIKDANYNNITLEKNLGKHNIHSGSYGWQHQFWEVEKLIVNSYSAEIWFNFYDDNNTGLGKTNSKVVYILNDNKLVVRYIVKAETDSIVNPTNHTYFNLSGNSNRTIENHNIKIESNLMLETTEYNIPTGRFLDLYNTSYNFYNLKSLSTFFKNTKKGLDDVFILNRKSEQLFLEDNLSGRSIKIDTTRKSFVIFSCEGMNEHYTVNGTKMKTRLGLAIEAQEPPLLDDSFILKSGKTKIFETTYYFFTKGV